MMNSDPNIDLIKPEKCTVFNYANTYDGTDIAKEQISYILGIKQIDWIVHT